MIFRAILIGLGFLGTRAVFSVEKNKMYYANEEYRIKGINWFDIETRCNCPHGLWIHNTEFYLNLIQAKQFNSIRVPFSFEVAMNLDVVLPPDCISADPYVWGFTARKYLHHLFYHAQKRKISILLDFHSDHGLIQPYPTSGISKNQIFQAWKNILEEYSPYKNLIGIDIKNEPHGGVNWQEWSEFVLEFISFVKTTIPSFQGLFWVQGIEEESDSSAWGGSFSKLDTNLGVNPNPRIVFSPHVYGVSVRGINSLTDGPVQWDGWFGFLNNYYENLVCIGEIGGFNGGSDATWHLNVLNYLVSKGITNFYYWCLNPDSMDTGGILAPDWTTLDQSKIDFCYNLQPYPTFIDF